MEAKNSLGEGRMYAQGRHADGLKKTFLVLIAFFLAQSIWSCFNLIFLNTYWSIFDTSSLMVFLTSFMQGVTDSSLTVVDVM